MVPGLLCNFGWEVTIKIHCSTVSGGITPRFTIDISGTCFSSHGLVQAIYNQGPFQDPTIPIKQMREANQQLSMEFDQNLNGFKTWPRSNYDLVGMIIPNISQLG